MLAPGVAAPVAAEGWPVITLDDASLARPATVVATLHDHWLSRQPVAVVLDIDPTELRRPEVETAEPWQLEPSFEFARERLQFLVWVNNWDARTGEPIWWWARKAARLGATEGGPADVVLADGTPAYIDGGPRQPLAPEALGGHALVHRESVELGRLTVARHAEPHSELAPDQLAAVLHEVGPARIIAPAGSGKTRVLTERLRHLLVDRGWEAQSVAAVAYNRRAADEMAARTAGLHADIRTLNSLGLAIVNGTAGFARPAGSNRRSVIEEPRVREILDGLVTVARAPNTDPYVVYLEGLRAIRLGLLDPADAEEECDAPGLAEVFPRFQARLDELDAIDFDGQLYEAVRVLLRDPAARATAQARSRRLLVDEFQDLTPVHVLLLRLLAAPAFDVFGVGDDDQVIYGFGGATPEFLIGFEELFPGATAHALEVNYRCPPAVVDAARSLLSYNTRRIDKQIRAAPGRATVPGELQVQRVAATDEAAVAADTLVAWHEAGRPYADMAALARVNAALLPLQITLTERNVPGTRPLDASILNRTGIRCALAYLRIGISPQQIAPADLSETIRRPSRRIARNVVDMLTRSRRASLADVRRVGARLTGGDADKVTAFAADLQAVVDAVVDGDTASVLRCIRDQVGLGSAMDTLDSSRREADRSTHADDLAALEQAAALHPDPVTFEAWLREVLGRRSDEPGVELSTIHRVKGQEWPGVIVFGVSDGLIPHRLASEIDEERRLLHVAITRAREEVVLLADAADPSPMLDELDGSRPHKALRPARGTPAAPEPAGRRRRAAASPAVEDAPAEVVDALKAWRLEVSRADKVPAYVVLSDADLAGIAARHPATLAELADCRGVGPTKLERYGDEILAVLDTL